MNNLLCFKEMGKFFEMLATPKFWYIVILLVGAIAIIIACFKHPAIGKWVLLIVFYCALIGVTIYSAIQLNFYYKARGGIFGQIETIFKPNDVQYVDDITYKFTCTELLQVNDSETYSADISLDEVLELTKGVKYHLLINDVPSGYTENNEDFIVADYNYIFYNEDMSIALQDTLQIRIAFYKKFTNFTVSTDGGAKAVKYWNHFFIKNDFVIKLSTKAVSDDDNQFGNGDVSNFAIVRYIVNETLDKTEVLYKGSKITYVPDIEQFEFWSLNGERIDEDFVVTQDIELVSNTIPMYTCKFVANDTELQSQNVYKNKTAKDFVPDTVYATNTKWVFDYWKVDNVQVDVSTYPIVQDTTFVAEGHYEHRVDISYYATNNLSTLGYWVKSGTAIDVSTYLPSNYSLSYCTINGQRIDSTNYIVNEPVAIVAEGYTCFEVKFIYSSTYTSGESVTYGEDASKPDDPLVEGKVFLGWSYDGHTVIEDFEAELKNITKDKTFIAVYSDEGYVLTIKDHKNGSVVQTISKTAGASVELTIPADYYENSNFVCWRILSGTGTISGNTFTFGKSDCTIYACFDIIDVSVGAKFNISYTYKGKTETTKSALMGGDVNSSIQISIPNPVAGKYSLVISTDGTYSVTGDSTNGYVISWTDASFISIGVEHNGTSSV